MIILYLLCAIPLALGENYCCKVKDVLGGPLKGIYNFKEERPTGIEACKDDCVYTRKNGEEYCFSSDPNYTVKCINQVERPTCPVGHQECSDVQPCDAISERCCPVWHPTDHHFGCCYNIAKKCPVYEPETIPASDSNCSSTSDNGEEKPKLLCPYGYETKSKEASLYVLTNWTYNSQDAGPILCAIACAQNKNCDALVSTDCGACGLLTNNEDAALKPIRKVDDYCYRNPKVPDWPIGECYDNLAPPKMLTGNVFVRGMTNDYAVCANLCLNDSGLWRFMGLESGGYCYCGNQVDFRNHPALIPSLTYCTTPCPGNHQEMCGGPHDRLNLYQIRFP